MSVTPAAHARLGTLVFGRRRCTSRRTHDIPTSAGRATLGRSPLLPSQPGESIAASRERAGLPGLVCAPVRLARRGGPARVARGNALTPDRAFLLRAARLRPGQRGDA